MTAPLAGLVNLALSGLRGGLSANKALTVARGAGLTIGRSTWLSAYRQAKQIIAQRGVEPMRPLNTVPTAEDALPFPTKRATGTTQVVHVLVRGKGKTDAEIRYVNVRRDAFISRADAIAEALDVVSAVAGDYDDRILGAIHVQAYINRPERG